MSVGSLGATLLREVKVEGLDEVRNESFEDSKALTSQRPFVLYALLTSHDALKGTPVNRPLIAF